MKNTMKTAMMLAAVVLAGTGINMDMLGKGRVG
jgi:hypothetical protein